MKTILIDFDTEPGRQFEDVRPIGVLLERGALAGFDSRYLEVVTEEEDSGHDNYVRTMQATEEFRLAWDRTGRAEVTVEELFTYLADNGYLGLRLRTLGKVDDGVTLDEAFDLYVVQAVPLVLREDEEFPTNV